MDQLWTPWRFRYMTKARQEADACVFCEVALERSHDRDNLVLYRGRRNFIMLNLYPYTSGHAMVAPFAHVADFAALDAETSQEMMQLAQRFQKALEAQYHPDGYNLGMNLGRAAGAGIIGHLHLHVLPRWIGDGNFMSVVGNTRVQPEDLLTTYDKLLPAFSE